MSKLTINNFETEWIITILTENSYYKIQMLINELIYKEEYIEHYYSKYIKSKDDNSILSAGDGNVFVNILKRKSESK